MPNQHTRLPMPERFWVKAKLTDDCWLWTSTLAYNGYGLFFLNGGQRSVHRLAWVLTHGPIPPGLQVLHRCDVKRCINPAHLWLGTHADNMLDRDTKGRTATGGRSGARLHPDRVVRGEACWNARLTAEQVTEIRTRYAAGCTSHAHLAAFYGVHKCTIARIIRRQKWQHVV